MQDSNIKEILERLHKELLCMQKQENGRKNDKFLLGRIDAYEEVIYILEGEPYK